MKLQKIVLLLPTLIHSASASVCSICGDGKEIANPEEKVQFVEGLQFVDRPTTCGEFQNTGCLGILDSCAFCVGTCNLLQDGLELISSCRCKEGVACPSDAPVDPPSDPPVDPPSDPVPPMATKGPKKAIKGPKKAIKGPKKVAKAPKSPK